MVINTRHTGLVVRDIDQSLKLYQDILGFKIKKRVVEEGEFISQMVGIGKQMPVTMIAFLIGAMSIIGLPLVGGILSKWHMVLGALQADKPWVLVIYLISSFLNAAYFLWAFQRVFFGKLNEKYSNLPDINRLELFTVVPLLIITLFLGIYPAPYLDIISSTMDVIIDHVVTLATYASI